MRGKRKCFHFPIFQLRQRGFVHWGCRLALILLCERRRRRRRPPKAWAWINKYSSSLLSFSMDLQDEDEGLVRREVKLSFGSGLPKRHTTWKLGKLFKDSLFCLTTLFCWLLNVSGCFETFEKLTRPLWRTSRGSQTFPKKSWTGNLYSQPIKIFQWPFGAPELEEYWLLQKVFVDLGEGH